MAKRSLSLVLALCCILAVFLMGTVDVAAAAPETPAVTAAPVGNVVHHGHARWVNPLHADLLGRDDADADMHVRHEPPVMADTYVSKAQAYVQFREAAKARATTITVSYIDDNYCDDYEEQTDSIFGIMDGAFAHTGVPTEGDYLQWHYGGCWVSWSYSFVGSKTYITAEYYDITYYSNAAQEQEMDIAVAQLLDTLDVWENTDYRKISTIYDYMTSNISYDYDNLNDDSHLLKYTAYAALVNGTSVCQGYANLFYRLALELGVDARLVAGYGGGPHSWNIVCLDGKYYCLDATWDAGQYGWYWFLLCEDNFYNHEPWAYEFAEYQFPEVYPMATSDYVYDPLYSNLQIVQQPVDVKGKIGETVSATVKAAGEHLSYQWYIKDVGSSTFAKCTTKTPTYSIVLSNANAGRQAYCIVADAYGNQLQSNTITFGMSTDLAITQQPRITYTQYGQTASVSVKAVGDGLKYQWYVKNADATSYFKSATSATYSVKMVSSTKDRYLYCVITDQYGVSVRTNTVQLRMAATVTTQPKTTYARQGANATVSVGAVGDGLTYKWYYKDVGDSKFYRNTSFTGTSYSVNMSTARHGRQVYCVVTDKYGNTAKTNTVALRLAVTITKQPVNAVAAAGKTAAVTVTAVGEGLTYEWYYKDVGASKFYQASVTGNTYGLPMNTARSGRQVYCIVSDRYGHRLKSDVVSLDLPATITTQPRITYTQYGETASVSVKALGNGLKYQWYVKNAGSTSYFKSSTSATYSVKMVSTTKDRYLYCVITDQHGNSVRTNTVQLRMAATITQQPASVTVANGSTASVKVAAVGDGLTYTWYYKDAGSAKFYRASVTGNTYGLPMNAARNGRQVYCVVADKYGNTVTSNTVTLRMK